MACTLFPYALALVALRHLSAFETTLAVNMEPVYAIVLAIVLLNEQRDLEPGFYLGVALIMGDRLLTPMGVATLGPTCSAFRSARPTGRASRGPLDRPDQPEAQALKPSEIDLRPDLREARRQDQRRRPPESTGWPCE